jgi:hypothetical protein
MDLHSATGLNRWVESAQAATGSTSTRLNCIACRLPPVTLCGPTERSSSAGSWSDGMRPILS